MPHRQSGMQGIRTVLVTEPAAEPLSTEELKDHLRVDLVDDDDLIDALALTARKTIEDLTGQRMITQTWKLVLDRFPARRWIEIPLGPTLVINSVKFTDRLGVQATQDASEYIQDLISEKARIVLKEDFDWPDPEEDLQEVNAVEVEFDVGYGLAGSDVDERLTQAMKLLVGHYYENREQVVFRPGMAFQSLPLGVSSLISSLRLYAREI